MFDIALGSQPTYRTELETIGYNYHAPFIWHHWHVSVHHEYKLDKSSVEIFTAKYFLLHQFFNRFARCAQSAQISGFILKGGM